MFVLKLGKDMDLRVTLTHLFLAAFLALGIFTVYDYSGNRFGYKRDSKVTVTGEAKSQQKTQVATFNAGVSVTNDNKDTAVGEVNKKIQVVIDAVKGFGIKEEDIKTQNLSIYQMDETYYEEGSPKSRPGQWRVSNDVSIKLRDIERASSLVDLLTKSGATSVYGPSFALDDTQEAEADLVDQAIKNAREKAEAMAKASGRKLGKVVTVSEGASSPPGIFALSERGGGGGAPIEPGSQTVSKTVTVTFELK